MNKLAILVLLTCLLILGGCNTLRPNTEVGAHISDDPMEGFNRSVYKFNSSTDKIILRPVAKGYRSVVPAPARAGVSNFFNNLNEPLFAINNLLQGKTDRTLSSVFRFVVNSTIGVLGLVDVASKMDVKAAPEDLGQTFASWGMKPGRYIMLPLLGPSNLRDTLGFLGETFSYYPIGEITNSSVGRTSLSVTNIIDKRSGLLGADSVLGAQLDPYSFLKVTYEQNRVNDIYDGSPPKVDDQELDF